MFDVSTIKVQKKSDAKPRNSYRLMSRVTKLKDTRVDFTARRMYSLESFFVQNLWIFSIEWMKNSIELFWKTIYTPLSNRNFCTAKGKKGVR